MKITDKYLEAQMKKLSEILSDNVKSSLLTVKDFRSRIDDDVKILVKHGDENCTDPYFEEQKVLDFTFAENLVTLFI